MMLSQAHPTAQFSFTRQPNKTGDFEVTVNGKLVHSKKNGEGWPFDNWGGFLEKVASS